MLAKIDWNRRHFMGVTAAAALGTRAFSVRAAEPPPETTRIRFQDAPVACFAPIFVAKPLLEAEGFTDVQYVKTPVEPGPSGPLASGLIDFAQDDVTAYLQQLDRQAPIVVLAGVHTGCWELMAQTSIRSVRELKGKTVAATRGNSRYAFVSAMVASVGLDPRRDIAWVDHSDNTVREFEQGKLDAMLGFVPEPQVLRSKKIGHVLINTLTDRPWSQYFCCLIAGNREFVRKHPVATRRALRALMKAADLCVTQPEAAARLMVDRGVNQGYEFVLQAVRETGYRHWREYEAGDTMRFWSLRLREAALIKAEPKKLLAQGTDWRFIEQIKRELKT